MKVTCGRVVFLTTALGAVCFLALFHGPVQQKTLQATSPLPGLPLKVMFAPENLDANTLPLYQKMQNAIDGNTVTPNDRTTYFSAFNIANGYVVNGWGGMIANVQQNANGHLVSIDVLPSLSSDIAACAIIVDSDYSEQYQVFPDGAIQFVGALDPQGMAGQMHSVIGL